MSKNVSVSHMERDRGYAFVRLNRRKIHLGKWGTPEAEKAYRRIIQTWASNPATAHIKPGEQIFLDQLCYAFVQARNNQNDHRNYKTVIEVLLSVYSGEPVEMFDFSSLDVVRKQFIKRRYCRSYVNKLTSLVRSIFYWGVPRKLVPASVAESLRYLKPLLEGQTEAPEQPHRQDVPNEVVARTLPYLLPTMADMVRVQRAACMRPSEVCRMRVGEIDQTGEVWKYIPRKHKNSWRNHKKIVALGEVEQAIIAPRLAGKQSNDTVFSPKDALKERYERYAAKRKTKVSPSQIQRKAQTARNPKRKVNDFYTTESYGKSIKQSIQTANKRLLDSEQIPHWTPY
jgi:integrase